jgi:hypothetical protein
MKCNLLGTDPFYCAIIYQKCEYRYGASLFMKRLLLVLACLIAVLGGVWTLYTPRSHAPEVLRRYVFRQIPDSFKILDFERQGHREWTAFFHFAVAPEDFRELIQNNNPVRIDPDSVHPDDFAALAIRLLQKRLPKTGPAHSYEFYELQQTNTVTLNYLAVNKAHSEGFLVVIRY